jgi:large subunit ribosomal protein L17
MPHRIAGRKLSRSTAHREHMLANLAVSVLRYERLRTTEAKAKEVRGMVDRLINTAKQGDLPARRKLVSQLPNEPLIIEKLMGELAAKHADRGSGFTRMTRLGPRAGDAAPMVQIELG